MNSTSIQPRKLQVDNTSEIDILKDSIANNLFTIAMSTNIDTGNIDILNKVTHFYNVPDVKEAENQSIIFLTDYLDTLGLNYIKAPGFYQGVANPDSYFIFADKYVAEELVENANEWFGQESIIAFGPDCSFEEHNEPVDFSTKLDDKYVVFVFDGEVIETPSLDKLGTEEVVTESAQDYEDEHKSNYRELNGYTIAIKNRATRNEEDYVNSRGWTEDDVAEATYNVAPIVYNNRVTTGSWVDTAYTKEDFTQEAALYMVGLFRKNYFRTDNDELEPIIYRMLNNHFVSNTNKKAHKDYKRNIPSLNRTFPNSTTEYIDMEQSLDNTSEDTIISEEAVEHGKEILDEIIDLLSFKPYVTRKHTYKGTHVTMGELDLSEKNIALLLLQGNSARDIIRIYGKEVDNIGTSSEASFVLHKVKRVVDNLAYIINGLSEEDREYVKTYINFVDMKM